jgi:NDP-sugar pyrophosphorylase family protein
MKSMILAAGMGTRLLPYTRITPKPLFPISGQPIIDISIRALIQAGSKAVIINTHHLHRKIDSFIKKGNYSIPVYTRYEPVILGTGGGIKNAADFFDGLPFMVVNSDIVTNINLKEVYDYHLNHKHPVTLVLYDNHTFNSVSINKYGFITNFEKKADKRPTLTFTGIQVVNPEVLDFIPANVFYSIIDAYKKIISKGGEIKAFISEKHHWQDVGTPANYKKAVFDRMAPEAFKNAFSEKQVYKINQTKLKGDGSERKWYRLSARKRSLIMVDHGIRENTKTCEIDSFVNIGIHLHEVKIPVPKIHMYDTFSGLVFLDDLGDVNLQTLVKKAKNEDVVISHYKTVIDQLVKMSGSGATGFDLSWTYQSETYDKNLIMEKECRYFIEAFLAGYLGIQSNFNEIKGEFSLIADKALESSFNGFMHRDLQSRNIMVKKAKYYFIDFQGGRMGPIEYDLASLLIDPYVSLSRSVQDQLYQYCIEKLLACSGIDPDKFCTCFKYCTLTRNLQILGAFGYLSRKMGKTYFEQYIPKAIKTLKDNLLSPSAVKLPKLISVVKKIKI